jgi:aspartate kinase
VSDFKVFKFGGASVKDAPAIQHIVHHILPNFKEEKLLIVVSAMGKTTNALEEIVRNHANGDTQKSHKILQTLKNNHYTILDELFEDKTNEVYNAVNDVFVEIEWVLEEAPAENYDYMYDQIVSVGELVSTKILAAYLNKRGLPTTWMDARDIVATDNNYREAGILWEKTAKNAAEKLVPTLSKGGFVITQGFIGSTSENFTTTLGREGSDYSAAIFSHVIAAQDMTIWKDVPGVLNADPRVYQKAVKLSRISFDEAAEMTYYGATVIHPRTIQPLKAKNIPLYVRSFLDLNAKGTAIADFQDIAYPPIITFEKKQALLTFSRKDFSFVLESHISDLFKAFDAGHIFVNLIRTSGRFFLVSVTNTERLSSVIEALSATYIVEKTENLELITIRHPKKAVINGFKKDKKVYWEETVNGMMTQILVG